MHSYPYQEEHAFPDWPMAASLVLCVCVALPSLAKGSLLSSSPATDQGTTMTLNLTSSVISLHNLSISAVAHSSAGCIV